MLAWMSAGQGPTSAYTRPKVLVVDGEHEALSVYERVLRGRYDVAIATSVSDAIAKLGDTSLKAVLVEQTLPGMPGVDLLERAARLLPHAGRILAGEPGATHELAGVINRAAVQGYVDKPVVPDALLGVVDRVVGAALDAEAGLRERGILRDLFEDPRTGLPTRQTAHERVADWLKRAGCLSVLCVDFSELWLGQADLGQERFRILSRQVVALLKSLHGQLFRHDDLLVIDETESPCFCIFLGNPRGDHVASGRDVALIAGRLQERLTRELYSQNLPMPAWWPAIGVGCGFRIHNPHLSVLYQVQQTVQDARDDARRQLHADGRLPRKSELERIILNEAISSVFQPIVELGTSDILGYEALSRGPAATEFESPLFLLQVADRTGLTLELDRVFRSNALTSARHLPAASKLFLNTLPATIYDPDLSPERLHQVLQSLQLSPSRLVFEFSERYVVPNQAMLKEALLGHRDLGVQIAIDDVGAGYSGLDRIAALEPNYLKIDASLVREIDGQRIKRSVLAALVTMASEIGAHVVAEGIETQHERDVLVGLGVRYGQGYHLGRPAPLARLAAP